MSLDDVWPDIRRLTKCCESRQDFRRVVTQMRLIPEACRKIKYSVIWTSGQAIEGQKQKLVSRSLSIEHVAQSVLLAQEKDHYVSEEGRVSNEPGSHPQRYNLETDRRQHLNDHSFSNSILSTTSNQSYVQIFKHTSQNSLRNSVEKRKNSQSSHPSSPSRLPRHRHSRATKTLSRTSRRKRCALLPLN